MTTRKDKNFGIVYSTVHGKMCPACVKPIAKGLCRRENVAPKGDGTVRVGRATKGRKISKRVSD